jgi:hypothetical protein
MGKTSRKRKVHAVAGAAGNAGGFGAVGESRGGEYEDEASEQVCIAIAAARLQELHLGEKVERGSSDSRKDGQRREQAEAVKKSEYARDWRFRHFPMGGGSKMDETLAIRA